MKVATDNVFYISQCVMLCSNKNSFTKTESQTMSPSFLRLKTTVTNIIHKSVDQIPGSADTGQAWLISGSLMCLRSAGGLTERTV